jgi:hypothetical protein
MLDYPWYGSLLWITFNKGYPGKNVSFSAMFCWPAKLLLILVRIIGRHRGVKKSVMEQEDEAHEEYMKKLVKKEHAPTVTQIEKNRV